MIVTGPTRGGPFKVHEGLRVRRASVGNGWASAGPVRTGKALWFDNGRRRSRNAELTALMMVRGLAPWTVAKVSVCLYLNPYVSEAPPRALTSFGYAAADRGELRRYGGTHSVRDLMGLPDDWPNSGSGI